MLARLGEQVIANQIAVTPPGVEAEARKVNPDLDAGIEKNLDAALITNRLQKAVKFDVENGIVTVTGEVNSKTQRAGRKGPIFSYKCEAGGERVGD